MNQPHLDEVPVGLPSAILERRPDVRQAEALLVAANANVGVAKAAFFPQIPLTASFGAQSTALTSFLQGPATFWTLGGHIAQPLYAGGESPANTASPWHNETRPTSPISKQCNRRSPMSPIALSDIGSRGCTG